MKKKLKRGRVDDPTALPELFTKRLRLRGAATPPMSCPLPRAPPLPIGHQGGEWQPISVGGSGSPPNTPLQTMVDDDEVVECGDGDCDRDRWAHVMACHSRSNGGRAASGEETEQLRKLLLRSRDETLALNNGGGGPGGGGCSSGGSGGGDGMRTSQQWQRRVQLQAGVVPRPISSGCSRALICYVPPEQAFPPNLREFFGCRGEGRRRPPPVEEEEGGITTAATMELDDDL